MKYFKVLAKCGHVGKNNYILKWFYLKSNSGKEAAKMARILPRVKHHHKDAIKEVHEITFEDYCVGKKINSKDMYFKSHSKQEQEFYNSVTLEEIYPEERNMKKKYKKMRNGQRIRNEILLKEMNHMIQNGGLYDR